MCSGRQKEDKLSDNCRTINNDLSLGDVPVGKPRRFPYKDGKANAPLPPVQSDTESVLFCRGEKVAELCSYNIVTDLIWSG